MTEQVRPFRPIPDKPIVRGRQVWLRPIDEGDLEAYTEAVNEQEPGWWAGYPGALSLREIRGWFENTVLKRHGHDGYWFTICPLGSDEFLGQIWLWDINHRVPGAEISVYVTSPGAGVGTDAIDAAVDFGFQTLRLRRIWGFTNERNQRSISAFERCGFVIEGRLRGADMHEGVLAEMVQFSMTVDDWKELERDHAWNLNEADRAQG